MVFVLPGIEGKGPISNGIARGIRDGGWDGAVEVHDWGTPAGVLGWYVHLTDAGRNRAQAYRLARAIRHYQVGYPNRPVYLVAHSGGAGIAVQAVEALPAESPVDSVVLLGAALAPEYDLRRALGRTRRGVWNFHSRFDVGFLAAGTSVFGTVDRRHGPAAGAVGFRTPAHFEAADRRLYRAKLHQTPYSKRMAGSGHLGNHLGWASPRFAADWLVPILDGTEPGARPRPGSTGQDVAAGAGGIRRAATRVEEEVPRRAASPVHEPTPWEER